MKKAYLFLLIIISITTICNAQDLKTNLDYQYKRGEASFSSYTAYLNSEENAVSLSIASSNKIDELKFIKVKSGKGFVDIPFSKLDINLINDDKTINSLVVKLDLKKAIQRNIDSETSIVFHLSDGNKIELPFMFCKLKEKIKP